MNALTVSGLRKTYPGFELRDVSFEIPKGTIMGFIGANGAGKTTTIKAILNITQRESGTIEILGMDNIKQEKSIKEQIGVVFEESNFHNTLKAREISNILRRVYQNWDQEKFESYLARFNLPSNQPIKSFSRGMQMKLNIAAAMSHHPKLLILDEPTSGLDPVVRDEILDIFRDFIQEEEHSILISSHITSDLDKIADYITFIDEGQILLSEAKDTLIEDFGVLKTSKEELKSIDPKYILKIRTNIFGVEALIKNRHAFTRLYSKAVIDNANLEEIMLFFIKGEDQ